MGSGGGRRLLDEMPVADRSETAFRVVGACCEREASSGTAPEGLEHDIPLHQGVLARPAFQAGELSTSFIDENIVPGS
jgi:hypothetical protein